MQNKILAILKKHGMQKSFDLFLKRFFPTFVYLYEKSRYYYCLKKNLPYFGKYLASSQGDVERYGGMKKMAITEIENSNHNEPFNILEIGSWAGGSAIIWAEALKETGCKKGYVFCVDPWKSYFDINIDKNTTHIRMEKALQNNKIFDLFCHNVNATNNQEIIKILRGKTNQVLPFLKPESFNLIYIDGSHAYQDVITDIKLSIPLLCPDGILCGDDFELNASQIDKNNAQKLRDHDYVLDPKTNQYFHPGVTFAIADTIGEVSSWNGFWAIRKGHSSWKQINLKEIVINNTVTPNL